MRHGGDRKSTRQVGDLNPPRFTPDTAAKTRQSATDVCANGNMSKNSGGQ
jgi:hypothetical protein